MAEHTRSAETSVQSKRICAVIFKNHNLLMIRHNFRSKRNVVVAYGRSIISACPPQKPNFCTAVFFRNRNVRNIHNEVCYCISVNIKFGFFCQFRVYRSHRALKSECRMSITYRKNYITLLRMINKLIAHIYAARKRLVSQFVRFF